MIIGLYDDNDQRYADTIVAKTALSAERKAPEGLRVAAVLEVQGGASDSAIERGDFVPMKVVL